jgi:hypothetical protein
MEESGYGKQETAEVERRNDGIPESGASNLNPATGNPINSTNPKNDDLVKSPQTHGKVKSSRCKARKT